MTIKYCYIFWIDIVSSNLIPQCLWFFSSKPRQLEIEQVKLKKQENEYSK